MKANKATITKCLNCGYLCFRFIGGIKICKHCGGKLEIIAREIEDDQKVN